MNLNDFDLKNILVTDKIYIISNKNIISKYNLINKILENHSITNGFLISPYLDFQHIFYNFSQINRNLTYNKYNPKIINEFIKHTSNEQQSNYLILDDCFNDRNWFRNFDLYNIFQMENNNMIFLCSEYPLYMTKEFHNTINCIILYKNYITKDLQLVFSYFASKIYNSFVEFENTIKHYFNENFAIVLYNNCIYKCKIEND